jgi:hypothetical protein
MTLMLQGIQPNCSMDMGVVKSYQKWAAQPYIQKSQR